MIVAVVSDLFFRSKIIETARLLDIDVKFFDAREAEKAAKEGAILVILDLMQEKEIDLIARIKQHGVMVVGYLPHVEIAKKKRAEDAGCVVFSRSEFSSKLAHILSAAKSA